MRVGTSLTVGAASLKSWDHPHACGDKHYSFTTVTARLGSSPCVWGQDLRRKVSSCKTGIIPMRVGTSPILIDADFTVEDHPHACGDKEDFC